MMKKKIAYTPYSHSPILTITDNFNWSLSDSINISKISVSNQSTQYHQFLKNFIKAKNFNPATAEQYWHLIQNLQHSIQSFNDYILSLQSEIDDLKRTIKKLKENQKGTNFVERYLCPVCLETFTTLVDLDDHILKDHKEISDKWNSFRASRFYNMQTKNISNIQQSTSFNKYKDEQNFSHENESITELHQWMVGKFNELEEMFYATKRKRRNRHHHNTNDEDTFHFQKTNNTKSTKDNNLANQNDNLTTNIKNVNPTNNDASPFHKSDKHILNLTESKFSDASANPSSNNLSTPNYSFNTSDNTFNVSTKPFNISSNGQNAQNQTINASENTFDEQDGKLSTQNNGFNNSKIIIEYNNNNSFYDSSQESYQYTSSYELMNKGFFAETIESNNNHSIFNFSTPSPIKKHKKKS